MTFARKGCSCNGSTCRDDPGRDLTSSFARLMEGITKSPISLTEDPMILIAAAKLLRVASVARAKEPLNGLIAT
jgi:hypothetical protein